MCAARGQGGRAHLRRLCRHLQRAAVGVIAGLQVNSLAEALARLVKVAAGCRGAIQRENSRTAQQEGDSPWKTP